MADQYVFDRGYPFIDPISRERAEQIYERAVADPEAALRGNLEEGFSYVTARHGKTELTRAKVRPVKADEPDALSGLGGEQDA